MDSSSIISKPKRDTQLDKCYVCQTWSSLKCSNCVNIYYCSVAHQKQDWKRHKLECHPFEVMNNNNELCPVNCVVTPQLIRLVFVFMI